MTAKTQQMLNDKAWARWLALILIASMMFFAYMFVDVMSPLKSLLEEKLHWDSASFGTYAASEYFLNVFFFFLIFAGIILDKMGIRFTGVLSASMMVIGATIKLIGVSQWFEATALCQWLDSWWTSFPGSAKMASFGFMIFGCGCEMAGTTVSKAIAKWFEGKEMALAMGVEMSIARLGVFAVMWISPLISNQFDQSIVAPVAFCTALLLIGLISYIVFSVMDTKFDRQLEAAGIKNVDGASDEEFHISDLGKIFSSKMFWLVAMLCVLYYSGIFPFQRYAPNYVQETLGVSAEAAARIFSLFPILAMVLTPFLGAFLDYKGKGATMLIIGAVIMTCCHLGYDCRAAGMACRGAHPRARRVVLAGARRPVALGAQDYRRQHPRLGLLLDFLDSEHRSVPRAPAHRRDARRHRRLLRADAHLRLLRRARHPLRHLAEGAQRPPQLRP